jgi:hypothetical protein
MARKLSAAPGIKSGAQAEFLTHQSAKTTVGIGISKTRSAVSVRDSHPFFDPVIKPPVLTFAEILKNSYV